MASKILKLMDVLYGTFAVFSHFSHLVLPLKLIRSFYYAFKGLYAATMEERNFRIHLVAIAVVCVAGIYFHLSPLEWAVIAVTIGMVIAAELFNTAIEDLVNLVSPNVNPKAGRIKDISAAAVLVTAIVALIAGIYIFGNKIFTSPF